MKNLIFLFAIMLMFGCSKPEQQDVPETPAAEETPEQTTQNGVPQAVLKSFQSKFVDAKEVEWEIEGDEFEAGFKLEGQEFEAEFDKDGNWLATEKEIALTDIPAPVLESIKAKYPDRELKEAEWVNSAKHGECYEVELLKDNKEMDVYFSPDGTFLEEEAEEAVEEKEDDHEGHDHEGHEH